MRMDKLWYKPLSLVFSAVGGLLAGMAFKRIWKLAAGQDEAPEATDRDRTWREVLTAAALQGAVFGLVKASVERAGAHGVHKATGRWPGDDK